MSKEEEREKKGDEEGTRGRVFSKNGTLPTLEKLLNEMAYLEIEATKLEKKKHEVVELIEENETLKARNFYLESENNTLKLDKNTRTTRSFDFPVPLLPGKQSDGGSSDVELVVLNRRHPAHEDDQIIVKIVTCFIFAFLPILLGIGIWAVCLLNNSKLWYDAYIVSPIKLPFFILGGVSCGIYGTIGISLYSAWYQMGLRRGVPYLILGAIVLFISYSYPPVLLIGKWYLPSFSVICSLWFVLLGCIMGYARISIVTGISILPCLIWTTYTAMFTFFPFYNKFFNSTSTTG